MSERFTPEECREFDAMLQEIKLRVMGDREATGSEAIEQAMRARIDGRTFREILVMGYQFKWERFDAERSALENAVRQNTQLTTRPGDTVSADYLVERRRQQLGRVEGLKAEVRLAEEKLIALGSAPPVLTPDEMPELLRTE